MRLFGIICLLAMLCSAAPAEDLIFFADDHYKALGAPAINASVVNPALEEGDSVLRIALANDGRLEELMPINGSGSEADLLREMEEEQKCTDALNLRATLSGDGPLMVESTAKRLKALPTGAVAELEFNLTVPVDASGWYGVVLHVDYEHQADVSVSGGEISPLYLPDNKSIPLRVFVLGSDEVLRILAIRSDLAPGKGGTILAVIKNYGSEPQLNCTARLISAPPFHSEERVYPLGDVPAGGLATASFSISVDGGASLQDYQLGCEVVSRNARTVLNLPVTLNESDHSLWLIAALLTLSVAGVSAYLIFGRQRQRRRMRR